MCQKQLSSPGSLTRRGARVLLALVFEVALLVGCLPQEDLSSYSSAWERQLTAPDTPDASLDTQDNAAGAGGTGGDAGALGTAGAPSGRSGDFDVDARDAGVLDASDPLDPTDSGSVTEAGASDPLADAAP